MKTNECCKYLGQNENILYVGPINKDSHKRIYKKNGKNLDKRTVCI